MRKGSKVKLRDDYIILPLLEVDILLSGGGVPHHGQIYTLSKDPFEAECSKCGKLNTYLSFEEFDPDEGFKAEAFVEIEDSRKLSSMTSEDLIGKS